MNDWNEIIGQKNTVRHLKRAVSAMRPSHAYIFHGDDGIGKRTVASLFAKSLQCENVASSEDHATPCGMCRACLQMDSGNQPDVTWVTHEKAEISVDEIRNQIVSPMGVRPYSSRFRIFIVDEAEKMNEKAQNALLKTLEEPPEYGIIILLGNNIGAFLDTIVSRSVVLNFTPTPLGEIKDFLMRSKRIPDYQAGIAAASSGGCPGLAYVLADSEEFSERRETSEKILRRIGDFDHSQAFIQAAKWAKNKDEIDFFLSMCESWIHDVLFLKSTAYLDGNTKEAEKKKLLTHVIFSQEKDYLEKQARTLSYEFFGRILDGIPVLRSRMKFNVSTEIAFSDFLLLL